MCVASFLGAAHDARSKTCSFEGSIARSKSKLCQLTFWGRHLFPGCYLLIKVLMLQKSTQTLFLGAGSVPSEKEKLGLNKTLRLEHLNCVSKLETVLAGTSSLRNTERWSQCIPGTIVNQYLSIYNRRPSHSGLKAL